MTGVVLVIYVFIGKQANFKNIAEFWPKTEAESVLNAEAYIK